MNSLKAYPTIIQIKNLILNNFIKILSTKNHNKVTAILIPKIYLFKEVLHMKIPIMFQLVSLMHHLVTNIHLFISLLMNLFLTFLKIHIKVIQTANFLISRNTEMRAMVKEFFLKILGFLTTLFTLKVKEIFLQEVLFMKSSLKIFIKMIHFILPLL